MKKILFTLIIVVIGVKSFCQQATYVLPLPEKWGSEKFKFPLNFAPKIPFKGIEELRFTPNWGKADNNDYWSYSFLWFIDGSPKLSSDILQEYMVEYFDGLYKSNDKTKSVSADSSFSKADFLKSRTALGDQETYTGEISTLNFLTGKPIEFFVRVHMKNYSSSKHSALLFELSPKDYDNTVWQGLDEIVKGFEGK